MKAFTFKLLSLCVLSSLSSAMAVAAVPEFNFEVWGRTSYGDGYVYGPPYRSSGVTVVDLDVDGDNDFVLPSLIGKPQVMRNLGSDRAFYPGGARTVEVPDPASGVYLSQYMDFADLTGDGLPDLVVVGLNYSAGKSSIYWYKNTGPRENPVFAVQGSFVYQSAQSGMACGAVDLADLDNDGKQDLCWVEFTMNPASDPPRLFYKRNTGTTAAPLWGSPVEIAALSDLLPAPRAVAKSGKLSVWANPKAEAAKAKDHAKVQYEDVVTDMEFGDWDADGDLDFMFYDARWGVDWALCVDGAADIQGRWDTMLDRDVTPYRHAEFFGEDVKGSFAVRPGPGLAQYPDFYVAVEGYLLTWRFNELGNVYEIVQENAVAHDSGTGSPAFWDYDGDGDLDMFRTHFAEDTTGLTLIRNLGTPYSPVWDWAESLGTSEVWIEPGTGDNEYRQELYTFGDYDGSPSDPGSVEFFLQDLYGVIHQYRTDPATVADPYPHFDYTGSIYGPSVEDGDPLPANVQPRGVALADFNKSGDGMQELITCWTSEQYVRLVYIEQVVRGGWGDGVVISELEPIDGFERVGTAPNESLYFEHIESVNAADIDRDGRPDLVLTLATAINGDTGYADYTNCEFHVYRNTGYAGGKPTFVYDGEIVSDSDMDHGWARMIGLADIDSDSDQDLFVGHQYYDPTQPNPAFNRYPYLHFYRNGSNTGIQYWQTRVVAGQSWTFTIGDTEANFIPITDPLPSGGDIVGGDYTAGATSRVTDIIQSTNASPNYRIFIDVLPAVGPESKAVLVVGGETDDPLYDAFEYLAAQAYDALTLQGIDASNIRLLSGRSYDVDGDGASDVFGAPTLTNLQSAVTNWATGSQRLLVYLVDHGQRDRFRMNSFEYLEASKYDQWLDQLQTATPACVVTTVIDTCEAGSFADNLALAKNAQKAGLKRIFISGSGTGPIEGLALFDQKRALSFSLPFWEEIRNGSTYGHAFSTAKVAIESINPLQIPQIDDNGNGTPNETSDGLLADQSRPGADFEMPASGVFIGEVAPNQTVSDGALPQDTATLWLSDVVAGFPVEAAGALIVPPQLDRPSASGDDEQPIGENIDWIDFTYNAAEKQWQGDYSGFTTGGLYRIQYYVRILGNYHASPRIGFVDRIEEDDAWEPDDGYSSAPWLTTNFVQGHNFDASGDTDWARFMAPPNMKATIAVLNPGPNCQPVVDLYRAADLEANAQAAAVQHVESTAPGREVIFERQFTASEPYLLRIKNKIQPVSAEGTSYMLIVAVGTGSTGIQNVLVVTVRDNAKGLLSAASVKVSGAGDTFNSKTTGDGIVQFICKNGQRYTVEALKNGYKQSTGSVRINNIIEHLELELVPETIPTVTLNLSSNRNNVKITYDGVEYDLPQTYTVQTNSQHSLSVPQTLSDGATFEKWSDNNTNPTRSVTVGASNVSLTAQYAGGTVGNTDINGDGVENAVDVQLVVNAVLGIDVPFDADANNDGATNAVDVQLVVNGVLGVG